MGIGLAAAVLIDATIVRAVLLPASMKLLGEANWYLPNWLQWLPRLEHEAALPNRSTRRQRSSPPPKAKHHHLKLSHRPGGATHPSNRTEDAEMTLFNQHVRLGRLAVTALLACLATALLAASATAEPTSTENTRAASLQKDVDALVAAGVPGAILVVRNRDHTVRLTGGLGDVGKKRR